jgi:hypothetical protein
VAGDAAAGADGATLKATPPAPVSPRDGVKVDTRRPALTFSNAAGSFQAVGGLTYRVELLEGEQVISTLTGPQATGAQTAVPLTADLKYATTYRWRVRGELEGAFTAYSPFVQFVSPNAPATGTPAPGGGGSVGPNRTILPNEVLAIIIAVHNGERWNLGGASTRDDRTNFWYRAVGIVHYGHPVYNPAGGDPDWCVKDAGAGRPPSDDVFVKCGTREAWDTISGAGANGYSFHLEYLGRLPGGQNVYPPPVPSGGGGGGSQPADPSRPTLPDVRALVAQFSNESPFPMATQSCPRGLKYVNNPWQDYIVDRLRAIDPRWGYNGKPTRTAADNAGVPVVAAGDEIAYYYGSSTGTRQGSTEVYLVDILEGHCGTSPKLTWRVFTGEEPGFWSGAGRF